MTDSIRGFTAEQYASITGGLIFEVRNCLMAIVGCCELANAKLEPSHPAFSHVAEVMKIGERAFAAVKQFDVEFHRRRNEETRNEERRP